MKRPFTLAEHPRRPQPLSAPPAGYFDSLPTRVMNRRPAARESAWGWWAQLPTALRTSLASAAVLLGFATSFWLSGPTTAPITGTASLDAVSRTELVGYLLTSGAPVENADLVALTVADPGLSNAFLHSSPAELDAMLDSQPTDETYL